MSDDSVPDLPAFAPNASVLAHLELMLGGVYPFGGFMGAKESAAVRENGQLPSGQPWHVPVSLPVPENLADARTVLLTDPEGAPLARLEVADRWGSGGQSFLAGPVRPEQPPAHGLFRRLRRTPAQVRAARTNPDGPLLAVVADRPLHGRALAQIRACAENTAGGPAEVLVLVNAPFHYERTVRAVLAAEPHLPPRSQVVAVAFPDRDSETGEPLRPDHAETLVAQVAAGYGATRILREPPGNGAAPGPELAALDFAIWRYDTGAAAWRPADEVPGDQARAELTDAEVEELLARGETLPEWFTPAAVAAELTAQRPPRSRRGLTVFFTGLSGSGKSTVARGVVERVREAGRTVTSLDGDLVRRMLSAGLTFSKADRDLNIRRIGFVAAEITRHGGVAVCAPIAPYAATRAEVRAMVEENGDFFLVHVATPLEVCEARDRKGLYAKARAGQIPEFTGISDPYEEPGDADLVLDTSEITIPEAVDQVVKALYDGGWLR